MLSGSKPVNPRTYFELSKNVVECQFTFSICPFEVQIGGLLPCRWNLNWGLSIAGCTVVSNPSLNLPCFHSCRGAEIINI